uniref:Potassium channel domain-containing protein n=1 Tax=Leptobrachium leishanense TaxID=445787 RepID=A0A8C5QTB0_9ANUR
MMVEMMWVDFLGAHPCLSEEKLEDFLQEALVAKSFGVPALRNLSGYQNKWDFVSSFFFSGTTLTTIGYGHPFPISWAGKVFCLVYSMIGIPLTFSILSITSRNLFLILFVNPLHSFLGHVTVSRTRLQWILASLILAVILLLFFFIPAVFFDLVEGNWEYLDALYFCFISLTTVGLGDFVPGEQSGQRMHVLYKVLVVCYLLLGLAAVLLAVEIVKSLVNWNRVFSLFLLGSEDVRRDEEVEPVLDDDLDRSFVQRREETMRRRVPHSVSPNVERCYGSISPIAN